MKRLAQKSLNKSILKLVISLVFLTAVSYALITWHATKEHAKQQLDRDFDISQNVLQQVLDNRKNTLFTAAKVLTDDFGFKQAVASTDRATIDSALLNHGKRIDADLMILISLDNKVITSVPKIRTIDQHFPYKELFNRVLENGGMTSLLLIDKKLYQFVMLTVDAPTPIAVAFVGFELHTAFVEKLKSITQLDTSIQVKDSNFGDFRLTTLPPGQNIDSDVRPFADVSWLTLALIDDTKYFSQQFTLSEEFGSLITITISENASVLFSEFSKLQVNILSITASVLIISLLFAIFLSKNIALPMMSLAVIAKNISKGEYQQHIDTKSNSKEFTHLAAAFKSMQTNIANRENEIKYQAQHDFLTSLYNRHHMADLLDKKFKDNEKFQAIGINILDFRSVNDVFGYHNGDLALKILSERISELGGISARLTGGELLWLPPQIFSRQEIGKIKAQLERPINTKDVKIKINLVFGLLECPMNASSAEELFRRLNITMDEAQINGQLIIQFESTYEKKYLRRLSIISELNKALDIGHGQFSLFYQPKLNLLTNQVDQVEALIRWNNEKLGFVSPDEFIIIAEHAGIMDKLTTWVVSQAIEDIVEFQQSGISLRVAVNLSANDILDSNLLTRIEKRLEQTGLSNNVISFEITESALLKDTQIAINNLEKFRSKGFEIAIDDFGTGYSSMAYLKQLPVDTLKVDKSFILRLADDLEDQSIVKTIIDLAHGFELNVVAEGVEDAKSLELLKQWSCKYIQGYFISKPLPIDKLVLWLNKS